MQDHWREFGPPLHISVNAFLGHKPPERRRNNDDADDFEADMLAMYPEGWG